VTEQLISQRRYEAKTQGIVLLIASYNLCEFCVKVLLLIKVPNDEVSKGLLWRATQQMTSKGSEAGNKNISTSTYECIIIIQKQLLSRRRFDVARGKKKFFLGGY